MNKGPGWETGQGFWFSPVRGQVPFPCLHSNFAGGMPYPTAKKIPRPSLPAGTGIGLTALIPVVRLQADVP